MDCFADTLACLDCLAPECVYEHHDKRAYRTRRLATLDQQQVDAWKKDKPKCDICPQEATRYAWNDGERVLSKYCDDHRGYAEHGYYEGSDLL